MTPMVENLKLQLGSLSPEERAELATFLLESLDPPEANPEAAWLQEVERRMEEMENGQDAGIPAEQVFAKLREKLS